MARALRTALAVGVLTGLPSSPAWAQGYRVRLDARAQAVSYRGLVPDSIRPGAVQTGVSGGLVTPDGFAVTCVTAEWCYYFRPGPERRAVPMTATASLVLWGLGVPGLSVHAGGRLVGNAGDDDAWPTVEPTAQLLEGYAQYERGGLTARAGRLLLSSRLEPIGFDGGSARWRWIEPGLDLAVYGGWGLGQAAVVAATSPLLNPLDEWRPRDRQLVAGAEAGWSYGAVDARAEYRREVDPDTDYFVSERAALSVATRPWRSLRATGGADWNLAEGHLGSADLALSWLGPRVTVTAGGRRYRPYFSLWTLWGAFSPVPYNALHGSAQVQAVDGLQLRARGERFWYESTEATTALASVEDRGWRASAGATLTAIPRLTLDASWLEEFGPGAASRFLDAMVSFAATDALNLAVFGGSLERPLELRFYDAEATWIGARAEWRSGPQWRLWGDASWFDERRDRPDPAASSLDQFRLRGGVTITFGTDADRVPLPPARRGRP